MADFLEERISDLIRYGSNWQDEFAVEITRSSGGSEDRRLIHPYPVRRFDVSYMLDSDRLWTELVNVYARAHGTFAGFRARCFDEWSTNGPKGAPTAFDQATLQVTLGSAYQIRKFYGTDKTAGATGYPYRVIKKPVAGTVKCAIGTVEMAKSGATWDVDTTTGIISFPANGSATITSISQATQAVIAYSGLSGAIYAGQSILITGVGGMTQINNKRALVVYVTLSHITIDLNTTAYSTYTSGGGVNTRPQSGETVYAGCEFDFPVRFDSTLPVGQDYPGWRPVESVQMVEILNP